jgi:hypothetical protein
MGTLGQTPPSPPQRRSPRFPIIASAEIVALDTQARLNARTSDVSLVGCYVDIANPLPVGTEIKLKLAHQDGTFTARGLVALSEFNLGMGITFTAVEVDQHGVLERWISTLHGSA